MKSIFLIIGFALNLWAPLPPGIAINPETKECGNYFGGDEYGGYVLPSPWEVVYEPSIKSDSGMIKWEGSVEGYCEQVGYTYVPGNLGQIYGKHRQSTVYYISLLCKVIPFILIIVVFFIGYSLYLKRMKKRKRLIDS